MRSIHPREQHAGVYRPNVACDTEACPVSGIRDFCSTLRSTTIESLTCSTCLRFHNRMRPLLQLVTHAHTAAAAADEHNLTHYA